MPCHTELTKDGDLSGKEQETPNTNRKRKKVLTKIGFLLPVPLLKIDKNLLNVSRRG